MSQGCVKLSGSTSEGSEIPETTAHHCEVELYDLCSPWNARDAQTMLIRLAKLGEHAKDA